MGCDPAWIGGWVSINEARGTHVIVKRCFVAVSPNKHPVLLSNNPYIRPCFLSPFSRSCRPGLSQGISPDIQPHRSRSLNYVLIAPFFSFPCFFFFRRSTLFASVCKSTPRFHNALLRSAGAAAVQRCEADLAGIVVDYAVLHLHHSAALGRSVYPCREAIPRRQDCRPGPRAVILAHRMRPRRALLGHQQCRARWHDAYRRRALASSHWQPSGPCQQNVLCRHVSLFT